MMDETRLVVQLAVGLVFLLSASGKLLRPAEFARGVADYQILPESLSFGVGLMLIPVEIFLASAHLSGWLLWAAVPLGLATLASFAIAVGVNLKRGRALPCHCFGGQGGETISGRTLARLLLLCAGELLLFVDPAPSGRLTYPDRVDSFAELGLALFWATLLLIAGLWLLSTPEVVALLRRCATCGARAAGTDARTMQSPPAGIS
jgi:hypothetical protein